MDAQRLAALRQEYTLQELDIDSVSANPYEQFDAWLNAAAEAQIKEPNAMTICTVGADGRPAGRIVLLKGVEEDGFVFYTNYKSRKGQEIAANGLASLVFYWDVLERQVRIEGSIAKIPEEQSAAYFQTRPYKSQLGALVSNQSEPVASRVELEKRMDELYAQYPEGSVPKPENWGGYKLTPDYFEFWQGRRSRLHDRLVYTPAADGWQRGRIQP